MAKEERMPEQVRKNGYGRWPQIITIIIKKNIHVYFLVLKGPEMRIFMYDGVKNVEKREGMETET